jgi:iron complex transport system substrate-binding protein
MERNMKHHGFLRYLAVGAVLAAAALLLFRFGFDGGEADDASREAASDPAEHIPTVVSYAKGFTIEYRRGYKVMRVLTPWRDAKTSFTYVLAPRGTKVPKMEPGAVFVETPVRSIILSSTTHVPFFNLLGIEDKIAGISGGNLVNMPSVAERIRDGRIPEVSNGGGGMTRGFDIERLIEIDPDLVMTYGTGVARYDHYGKLMEAGFRVAMNSEYMELTPLGRSEWIKFVAAFFDMEAEADRLFSETVDRYEALTERARGAVSKPTVFSGYNNGGVWNMPGGESYVAAAFRDAGARYLWDDDNSTGSIPLHVEAVLERAGDADIWIHHGTARSLDRSSTKKRGINGRNIM